MDILEGPLRAGGVVEVSNGNVHVGLWPFIIVEQVIASTMGFWERLTLNGKRNAGSRCALHRPLGRLEEADDTTGYESEWWVHLKGRE